MKSIVLSLVFLFVVSLGVQAQSTVQKKEKVVATALATDKKEKCAHEQKSDAKGCCADKKGCSAHQKKCSSEMKSEKKANCGEEVKEASETK